MIITKIEDQKRNKGRKSVYIDDAFAFGIDEFDCFKLKLKVGLSLTEEELNTIKETVIYTTAKEYATNLTSKRPYTKKQIENKLKLKEFDTETINKTIEFLKNYKLIDDFDYAIRFISDAFNLKGLGMSKIKYELLQKGINENVIEDAMQSFDTDALEEEKILALAEKKLKNDFEFKNIMKTKRYLLSKGYSFELIDKTIKKLKGEK